MLRGGRSGDLRIDNPFALQNVIEAIGCEVG